MKTLLGRVHPEWRTMVDEALKHMDVDYLNGLGVGGDWLPGKGDMFAAFSRPLSSSRYILLGESPYPRPQSANGFAFWDSAVKSIWGPKGLSTEVNRATSLRNLLKMLLYARGDLQHDFTQEAIIQLDKAPYIQTAQELFEAFLHHGFVLLNATLVFSKGKVNFHARHWRPFIHSLLQQLAKYNSSLQLVLLGRIAQEIPEAGLFPSLRAEHPYNISFITNPNVVEFFKPMDLLAHHE